MTGNAEKFEKVDTFGEVPLARFGHTITQVSKSKVILFGGATGFFFNYFRGACEDGGELSGGTGDKGGAL